MGLPWPGAGLEFTRAVGVDTSASPSLQEVMPVRRHHQQAVRETLENLTDAGLAEVRAARPGACSFGVISAESVPLDPDQPRV